MSVVILNFHGVGPVTREIHAGERNCWLDQSFFEAVLDLAVGKPHVRLTFDDGNASDANIALPALQTRGLQATFFVCSGLINQPTYLGESDLSLLRASGMTIGSHGVDHLAWRTLPDTHLNDELAGSKAALEAICGGPVDHAACPFGSYNRRVLANLRRTGYRRVYTSDGGTATPHQWLQARTTITRSVPFDEIKHFIQQGPGLLTQVSINARKLIKRLR